MQMISVIYFGLFLYVEHFVIVKFIFTATGYVYTICVSLFEFCLAAANDQYSDEHEMSPEMPLGSSFAWAVADKNSKLNFQFQNIVYALKCVFF